MEAPSPCVRRSPEDAASCFSWVFFRWLTPHVVKGYNRRLEHKDRLPLSHHEHIAKTYARFSRYWDDPVLSSGSSRPLARAIWRTFAPQLRRALMGRIFAVALELAGPVLLHEVVLFLSSSSSLSSTPPPPLEHGIALAAGMTVVQFAYALVMAHSMYVFKRVGIGIRTVMIMLCFEKCLTVEDFEGGHKETVAAHSGGSGKGAGTGPGTGTGGGGGT